MNSDKISIIIPTFNCATYLQPLLESIVSQTYENIQIIVVNDGSTDNTESVIQDMRDKVGFDYIVQPHTGANVARKAGLEIAKGEYIFFSDADAILSDTKCLEKLYLLASYPKDWAFSYSDFHILYEMPDKSFNWGRHMSGYWDEDRMQKSNYISMMCLWRRGEIPDIDITINKFQEWDMFLSVVDKQQRGLYISEKLFTVYLRKDGMSNKNGELWKELIRLKHNL